MKSTKGATRYAKALLELSIEQNKLAITEANMNYLIQVNNDVKEFHTLIHSPIINADKKIKAFAHCHLHKTYYGGNFPIQK